MKINIKKLIHILCASSLIFTQSVTATVKASDVTVNPITVPDIPIEFSKQTTVYTQTDFDSSDFSTIKAGWVDYLFYPGVATWSVSNTEGNPSNSLKLGGNTDTDNTTGYFALKSAYDRYANNDPGTIHKISFDVMSKSGGTVLFYFCKPEYSRLSAGLKIEGTKLTSIADNSKNYGTLPADEWCNVEFLYNIQTDDMYTLVNGQVVDGAKYGLDGLLHSLYFDQSNYSNVYIDNISYTVLTPGEPGEDSEPEAPSFSSPEERKAVLEMKSEVAENFDELSSIDNQRSLANGYIQKDSGTWSVIDEENGKSLCFDCANLEATNSNARIYIENTYTSAAISEISFDMYFDDFAAERKIDFKLDGGWITDDIRIVIDSYGNLTGHNVMSSMRFETGKWYTISFFADCVLDRLWVSVDGEVCAQVELSKDYNYFSIAELVSGASITRYDNFLYTVYAEKPAIESVSAENTTIEIVMNTDIKVSENIGGKNNPIDFTKLISIFGDDTSMEISDVQYDAENRKFIVTTKSPFESAFNYTVLMNSIQSVQDISIPENYKYDFKSKAKDYDIISVISDDDGKITAKVVNKTGENKNVVMIVVSKDDNGAVTSVTTSETYIISEKTKYISVAPSDANAQHLEVMFINSWETGVPLKFTTYKITK